MPEQYTTKQLQELSDNDLSALLRQWVDCDWHAPTQFARRRANRMIDRIRREFERRGL